MFENLTIPSPGIKPILIGISSIIGIAGMLYGGYRYMDGRHQRVLDTYTAKIAAQDKVISADAEMVSQLQGRLAAQVAVIAPAKAQAQSAKAQAEGNVAKVKASAPLDAIPAINQVEGDFETALTDEGKVTEVTQEALDTCQETVNAQAQEITDQATQIGTVKEDLAATQVDLQTQTERKKEYRAVAAISTGLIVLRVIIGIVFHVPLF